AGQEDQTLKQWKKDAVKNLTDRVGQWLLDGELSSGEWDAYQEEWSDFRVEVLQETFDSGSWASLWKNLHERDLKRLVPRLNREKLSVSLVQAKTTVRDHFAAALPERQVHMIFDEPPASKKHLDVLKAREEIFSELRETIPSINHDLVGELKLGD
ncbi:MAG: FliG C-terminal domain-containing protein, partial [bacterium]